MRQKSMSKNDPAERTVRDIRRKTRKQYTAEEKIRIVVPRKWRFVTRIPEDDRGKTSNAAIVALFEDDPGQSVEPVDVG